MKTLHPLVYVGGALTALLLLLTLSPFTMVGTGYRGVVTHFGKVQPEVLDEGIHFVMPIVTSVHRVSVQIQKTDLKTEASSKDLQLVTSEVAVNWTIDAAHVNSLYQTIGDEEAVVKNILTPAVSEVFKSATSKKTAEEIITRRNELSTDTEEMLRKRLAEHNIILGNISVVNLQFGKEFSHAIEAKQVAEQEAKQAEYTAMKATADAKSTVNKAKGDAEAAVSRAKGDAEATLLNARAQAEAQKLLRLTLSPELLQLKAVEKWNGDVPQVMGSGSNLLFNIPTGGKKASKEE